MVKVKCKKCGQAVELETVKKLQKYHRTKGEELCGYCMMWRKIERSSR